MKIELQPNALTNSLLILQPENQGEELQIKEMRKLAGEKNIDVHAWRNEDGHGLTFFLKDDRDAGQ